ncbi:hypothetical protein CMI37_12490 [Candidatus Pacearchaeota archaeon]|nr:hypothetical protein [Candidatus Pacearchaeota archaeon]
MDSANVGVAVAVTLDPNLAGGARLGCDGVELGYVGHVVCLRLVWRVVFHTGYFNQRDQSAQGAKAMSMEMDSVAGL